MRSYASSYSSGSSYGYSSTVSTVGDGGSIWFWVVALVLIVGFGLAVYAFYEIALGKGHNKGGMIFALALFASPIVAGLYVCALPDENDKANESGIPEADTALQAVPQEQGVAAAVLPVQQDHAGYHDQQATYGYPQQYDYGYQQQAQYPYPQGAYQQPGQYGYQQPQQYR